MGESWTWANCLSLTEGSGNVPTPLPHSQAWTTPLCYIFTGEKKKGKPLGQQLKNSGKEKASQRRQGPPANEKEKEEQLYTACELVNAATHASQFLG